MKTKISLSVILLISALIICHSLESQVLTEKGHATIKQGDIFFINAFPLPPVGSLFNYEKSF